MTTKHNPGKGEARVAIAQLEINPHPPSYGLTPEQPTHPDHLLYLQIREGVTELDTAHGRTFDEISERLTGSLLELAKLNGLNRVDHVVLSDPTHQYPGAHTVFVVQGELDNPAHRRAGMPTVEAVKDDSEGEG